MYAKISVISVILKPFIPHDSFLIICVTFSHSSILSLLKTNIFYDFHLLHSCNPDTPQFLQTYLRFLNKIILLSFLHIFMNMDNFVFSLFAMQLYIWQNYLEIKSNALLPLFKAHIKILCESYGKFHIFPTALFHVVIIYLIFLSLKLHRSANSRHLAGASSLLGLHPGI